MGTSSTLCSPLADLGRPVQHQVVVDQVDAHVFGVAPADVLVECQDFGRRLGQAIAAEQHVRMEVIATEEVPDATLRTLVTRRRQGRLRRA